ncbi:MAG: hypothetical protein WEB00_04560 [Dehalococcoidia bacterium]
MKVFTDNVILAFPLRDPVGELAEPELVLALEAFSAMQLSLALDGFLIRGGIAFGRCYLDADLVYGDALLEAVKLDRSGDPPRLVLAPSMEPLVNLHLSWYASDFAPHLSLLLEDQPDQSLFLNYLSLAEMDFPDSPFDEDALDRHRRTVLRGLETSRGAPMIRRKYEWVAAYHNYFCQSFADRWRPIDRPDVWDQEQAARWAAQSARRYMIEPELFTGPGPAPLSRERLGERVSQLTRESGSEPSLLDKLREARQEMFHQEKES